MNNSEKLFDQFPAVTTQEWMEKIEAGLKGADFKKKLIWRPLSGIEILPFYRQEDLKEIPYSETCQGEFPFVKGVKTEGNNWRIRQNIVVRSYREANQKARQIMMSGVDSLGFIIEDPETISGPNLHLLLENIIPVAAELNFRSAGKAIEIAKYLKQTYVRGGGSSDSVPGAVEADPLGRLMLNGTLCIPVEKGFDYLASLVEFSASIPDFRTIDISAWAFRNAGADIVTELAFAMAMGSEYMSQLTDRGVPPAHISKSIRFSFGTGSEYFPEIAKLRAARLLWSAVMNRYLPGESNTAKTEIHAITSRWNKTVYDPYVNMLRTQTEAMSAVLGGADSVTVEPYDTVFRKSDDFSERIARNQQLLLREESYFDKVADPAAGSYYIEKITSLLAEEAWKLFVKTEEEGGFLKSLKSGAIQSRIKQMSAQASEDVSKRKIVFLGTSQYPNLADKASEYTDEAHLNIASAQTEPPEVEPISFLRGAEKFEKIRIAVEKSEKKPLVFILATGDISMSRARAGFSTGFFGCAGYEVTGYKSYATVEDGITEAAKMDADIVVLCSSDEEYAALAPEAVKLSGDRFILVIAGNPPTASEIEAAGINHFISVRSNVTESLATFNRLLEIQNY